jgi:hypothetical protein
MCLRCGIERFGGVKGNWEVGNWWAIRIALENHVGAFDTTSKPAGNRLREGSTASWVEQRSAADRISC